MAPRLSLFTSRAVAFRTRPIVPQTRFSPFPSLLQQQRSASDDATKKNQAATTPVQPGTKGPNMDPLPHVTEEQAALDKTMGETPPDIEQGTPVQEIFKRDKAALENAPEVVKQSLNKPSGTRSFSTSARRSMSAEMVQFEDTRIAALEYPDAGLGHKFPLPDLAQIGKSSHFRKRYDPVVEQMTTSIMQHGKLSVAQKNMQHILDTLRTSPPPQANKVFTDRDLATTLPREALPLSPVEYLTAIIDSVAPLVKVKQQKGLAGGGASLPIPGPLNVRQRRRTAIQWILAAAEGRNDTKLADRVAKELIAVAEGRSGAWERRQRVHKLAISSRSNVRIAMSGKRIKHKSK